MTEPPHVLVVDDDPDDRALILRELERGSPGCAVTSTSSSAELERALAAGGFDAVITDYQLGWGTGLMVLRRVKERWPDCPVVMFTGTENEEAAVQAMKDGLDDYVIKTPAHFRRLPAALLAAQERARGRRAERERASAEQRFELLARATRDAIWDWDLVHDRVWWSEAFYGRFGFDRGTAPSCERWASRIHDAERERVLEGFHAAVGGDGDSWSDSYRYLLADGTYGHILDRGFVRRGPDGRATRMLGAMTDVTELRRAEGALRESEELFRAMFERAHVAMCILDEEGRFRATNAAYDELLGYRPGELLGHRFTEYTYPDDLPPDPWESAYEAGVFRSEKRYLRSDGSVVWVDLRSSQIQLPAGRWAAFVVVADVTERKRLEGQLLQSQKLEAIGRLAGGIAHDFNNLLTAISGYGEMLSSRLPEDSPLRHDVEQIEKAGERAATLTRQLLAFSRRQMLRPTALDLNGVVSGIEPMLRRLIGEDVELRTACRATGLVSADAGQLEQVIVNLVVNARDAMPAGGSLTIETASVHLDAEAARLVGLAPGPHVTLAVSDTGTGMDEEVASHAFEPFFTTKEPGRGTGLGLSTVHGIVEQTGGRVLVESVAGRGSTFTIYLPRVADEASRAPRAVEPRRPLRGVETILLVEDDGAVRALVREALERQGYTVVEVADGAEAVALVESGAADPQLLLTDVVMPGMSGPELATRIGALRPDLRVLYMSGYLEQPVPATAEEAGVGFIGKPFTPTALLDELRALLGPEGDLPV